MHDFYSRYELSYFNLSSGLRKMSDLCLYDVVKLLGKERYNDKNIIFSKSII